MPEPRFLLIVLLALTLRLAIVAFTLHAHPPTWFFTQASELGLLAEHLGTGQGLSSPFGGNTGPSAFLAPAYPAFIAAVFALCGSYSAASEAAIMAIQALFGTATVLALMRIADRLFTATTANLAGILWALAPPLLFLPTIFWETSLSILLATSLFLFALRAPTWQSSGALGLTSAFALTLNPSLLPIVLCCFAWAFFHSRHRNILGGFLLFLVLSTIWPIRNYRELHAFIPLRDNLGYELWQGNRPGAEGFFDPALHPNVSEMENNRLQLLGELPYMHDKLVQAKTYIAANPKQFLTLTTKRVADFWFGIARQPSTLVITYITLTTLAGLAGLIKLARHNRSLARLFLLPLLFFPAPYYITHPDFRFRLVLDPLLVVLVAYLLTRQPTHQRDTQ